MTSTSAPSPIVSTATTRRATPGERLALGPGWLWQLDRGEVVVYVHGRPIDVWRAPRPLDVTGSLGHDAGVSVVAATEVVWSGRPLPEVGAPAVAAALAAEARELWRRVDADARRDDDTFLAGARLVPGPWHFREMSARMLVVQGEPSRLRACLPRRVALLPGTGGRYLLSIARFAEAGSSDPRAPARFTYHEVTPFVPVWSGRHGPAMFVPELYPDAWMAVLLGQMIQGFPKRTARIGFHDDGADLLVDRRHALRLRFGGGRGEAPSEALGAMADRLFGGRVGGPVAAFARRFPDGLGFSVLVHKAIPDPRSAGRTFAIDDVVRVPVRLDRIRAARRLCGLSLSLPGGPGVLHGTALAGWELQSGFRFGAGTVDRHRGSRR